MHASRQWSRLGRMWIALAVVAAALASACGSGAETSAELRVARVVDGDTLVLSDGRRVRLVQIDTPELAGGECYGRSARRELERLAPPGSAVTLEHDPRLDRVDGFGRLLGYLRRGKLNVNVELVRRGAATVWFYRGERGRHAELLLETAAEARRERRRGLWGACPRARWDPSGPAQTG